MGYIQRVRNSVNKRFSPCDHCRSISEDDVIDFMRFQKSRLIHNRCEELRDQDRYFVNSSQDIVVQDVNQPGVHPNKVRVPHCPSIEFPTGWEIGNIGFLDEPK